MHSGLAVYDLGKGAPLLLMPYPHAYSITSTANGALARLLVSCGLRVITFDPPGSYRSTRSARVTVGEMLDCAEESLQVCRVNGAVPVAGHSMGGLCALAFAIEHPERVSRLILVGSIAGGKSPFRHGGMPMNWLPTNPRFWRFVLPALRLRRGTGTLADLKRLSRTMQYASFVDKSKVPVIDIEPGDEQSPAPVRSRWPNEAVKLDYRSRLGDIKVPTVVCVGRHDPQAPVGCSKEIAYGIPGARLAVFENSGHSPQVEEPARFKQVMERFLQPRSLRGV